MSRKETIPDDLPRLPYSDGSVRREVSVEQLSTGEGVDRSHPMKWGGAIGEYATNRSGPPTLPEEFADLDVDEVGDVTVGDCSKPELLELLAWFNYRVGRLDADLFEDDPDTPKEETRSAAVVRDGIEAIDGSFLAECVDDYSDVGELPASLVESIENASCTEQFSLDSVLNLNAIAITLGRENFTYAPEDFAGLFYEFTPEDDRDGAIMILFGSGDVFCFAGAEDDCNRAHSSLRESLSDAGLL
jgi:hypothetical protein